jgi:hypothetical protein
MIIWLAHRSMKDDSKVANKLYIKTGCLMLEDFHFFSLYSFSSIASNSTTWEYISTPVIILVSRYAPGDQSSNIHMTCARPRPLHISISMPLALNELYNVQRVSIESNVTI